MLRQPRVAMLSAMLCMLLLSSVQCHNTCKESEKVKIVKGMVKAGVKADKTLAAGLLRLHFHDCFVNGCDASDILEDDTNSTERYSDPNLTLAEDAIKLIDSIKAALDSKCGNGQPVLSCADIMALAARDAVSTVGGPDWDVKLGRKDGEQSTNAAPKLWLPSQFAFVHSGSKGHEDVTPLATIFARVGLDGKDLVALSGAHTIGKGHCASFEDRLVEHPVLKINSDLKSYLASQCPSPGEADMDVGPSHKVPSSGGTKFDNSYFKNLQRALGMFTSDMSLLQDSASKKLVQKFASSQDAFFTQFAKSMVKMASITPKSLYGYLRDEKAPPLPVYPGNKYGKRKGSCSRGSL